MFGVMFGFNDSYYSTIERLDPNILIQPHDLTTGVHSISNNRLSNIVTSKIRGMFHRLAKRRFL